MKRKLIWWVLLALLVWFLYTHFSNIKDIPHILARGRWQFVVLAAIFQFLYYASHAALYQNVFGQMGVIRKIKEILPIIPASIFINSIAPTAGLGGVALFVDDAKRRGEASAKATVGFILTQIFDYASFGLILAFSLFFLSLSHNLKSYEVIGSAILLALIIALVSLVVLAMWQQEFLTKNLCRGEKIVNKISSLLRKSPLLSRNWAERHTNEFIEVGNVLRHNPGGIIQGFGFGFLKQAVDILSLYALFLAFRQPVDTGVLVSGFAIGILFWIISITPQGIGVVEGVMTIVYTSLGIPAASAAIIAVAFRGLTFWLPLLIGIFTLRKLHDRTADNSLLDVSER